jgi:hypothetical protein
LALTQCSLQFDSSTTLSHLSNLKSLDLTGTHNITLEDDPCDDLEDRCFLQTLSTTLTGLTRLNLSEGFMIVEQLATLSSFKNLQELWMHGVLRLHLAELRHLQGLPISSIDLTARHGRELVPWLQSNGQRLQCLRYEILRQDHANQGAALDVLRDLNPPLVSLDLRGFSCMHDHVSLLTGLTQLTSLVLHAQEMKGEAVGELTALSRLSSLTLFIKEAFNRAEGMHALRMGLSRLAAGLLDLTDLTLPSSCVATAQASFGSRVVRDQVPEKSPGPNSWEMYLAGQVYANHPEYRMLILRRPAV